MANLQIYNRFSAIIDNKLHHGGSIETPVTFSLTNTDIYERIETIANSSVNSVLYADELASFNFLYVASDFNTSILLTDAGSNTFRITLRGTGTAGKYGVPFILAGDVAASSNEINSIKQATPAEVRLR